MKGLWEKMGHSFSANNHFPWMVSHAQIPVVDVLQKDRVRIYFGTRDLKNRTSTGFVEVDPGNPSKILYLHDRPVLSPGKLGAFDDSGAMPSSIVEFNRKKFMYYIGWNTSTTVRYRNAIGVAVSEDGGRTFERLHEGPVMDRTPSDPFFVVTPFVILEENRWKMWYCSCTEWRMVGGIPEPRYQIKYAESDDGILWKRENKTCIPYESEDEANTRPCVIRENGIFQMWYCFRSIDGYRSKGNRAYRIGYAESGDGKTWRRMDSMAGIDVSDAGWDSEMLAYPYVFRSGERKFMLYNGNGFGRSGFGCAVMED